MNARKVDKTKTPDGNSSDKIDSQIQEKLGLYVYALRDPRDRKIFYVGKAGGNGEGNSRPLDHFAEARKAIKDPTSIRSAKIQRIIEIWSMEEDVEWIIVRRSLRNPEEAHNVEAALIDVLEISPNGSTLNDQAGHGAASHGPLSRDELEALNAEDVSPKHNNISRVFIFPIHVTLKTTETAEDATKGSWRIGQAFRRVQNDDLAVGVSNKISKGVFAINGWEKTNQGDLWDFNPQTPCQEVLKQLQNKNFSGIINKAIGYFQRGNFLVVEFDRNGRFRFLRGSRNRDWFDIN